MSVWAPPAWPTIHVALIAVRMLLPGGGDGVVAPSQLAWPLSLGKDRAITCERGSGAMREPIFWWSRPLAAAALGLVAFASLPASGQTAKELRIGVQFGLGYLPLYVAND